MQRECMRDDAILELFCINNPSAVKAIDTILGISDHDGIILVDMHLKVQINKKPQRRIPLRARANWEAIKAESLLFCGDFLKACSVQDANTNWDLFVTHIKEMQARHIPTKLTSSHFNLPGSRVKLRECAGKSVAFIAVPRGPKRLCTGQPLSSYRTRPETPHGKPIGLILMGQIALRKVISNPSMAIPKWPVPKKTAMVCLPCVTMASSTRMHLLRLTYWAISLNLCSPQMSLTLTSDSWAQNSPLYHHWW